MEQIFDLCYYSNGAFSYTELYTMPVNLRSWFYAKLAMVRKAENATAGGQGSSSSSNKKITMMDTLNDLSKRELM
ncbi:MAG: hypothetical protein EBS55_14180 [Flavobacteriaceae bacterium]|nr:hypothetical protein [Flavobacteriaceae bacterium]